MSNNEKDYILLVNPNNLAVKINYNTPIYAHYDRETYDSLDDETGLIVIKKHKCVLHIDTFLKNTNFSNIAFSVIKDNTNILNQIIDEEEAKLILQDDAEEHIDTGDVTITANYSSIALEKTTAVKPNKTLVCSNYLKTHKELHPFDYDAVFNNQEVDNNE